MRVFACLAAAAIAVAAWAQNVAYCNITSVTPQQLSNGVQITIKADGVLEYRYGSYDDMSMSSNRMVLNFTNAKSLLNKTFIDVSKYPVSYIQLSVPQSAKEGVGIEMVVALFEYAQYRVSRSNDQQSVIITVDSERTPPGKGVGAGETKPVAGPTMEVASKDGLLTVNATKTNLRRLIAHVAHEAGVNVVVDDSVKDREVSLSFAGLQVDEALQAVATASGLALSRANGVTMITDGTPTDLATYHLASTESFRMKYIRADDASGLLPTFLYSFLHVNKEQNAVVVTAPDQMLDKIRADFKKIDIAPPQIMIEAIAVEAASTEDLAADLGLQFTGAHVAGSTDSTTGDISYSTVGQLPASFEANLNALVSKHKANVRATPRMAAINGQSADIFIGQTRFIKVEVTSYGGKQEKIQGVDVGVKLAVRPWTGGNGEITVTLAPEVSNISELDRATGLPELSTRRAQTTVRVKDGETIMIGGLVQRQDYVTKSKVPLLGDLPLLGPVFRSKKTNSVTTDLVIFVTPHILDADGHVKGEESRKPPADKQR